MSQWSIHIYLCICFNSPPFFRSSLNVSTQIFATAFILTVPHQSRICIVADTFRYAPFSTSYFRSCLRLPLLPQNGSHGIYIALNNSVMVYDYFFFFFAKRTYIEAVFISDAMQWLTEICSYHHFSLKSSEKRFLLETFIKFILLQHVTESTITL